MTELHPLGCVLYRELPPLTILSFDTTRANTVRLQVVEEVGTPRLAGTLKVELLEAPAPFEHAGGTNGLMFAVRAGTITKKMAGLYRLARPTITGGDNVYVIWLTDRLMPPLGLTVAELSIGIPV